jgi:hypothetical protein
VIHSSGDPNTPELFGSTHLPNYKIKRTACSLNSLEKPPVHQGFGIEFSGYFAGDIGN